MYFTWPIRQSLQNLRQYQANAFGTRGLGSWLLRLLNRACQQTHADNVVKVSYPADDRYYGHHDNRQRQ